MLITKNKNMYRNPGKVRELEVKVNGIRQEYKNLLNELRQEKELAPVGYEIIGSGDLVKEGALAFEPHSELWYKAGNSIGETLNEQGYVTGVTHRGYKYANPI